MDSISNVVSSIASSLLLWIPVLALVLGFVYVMVRTQSLHFLRHRFWLVVYGSKEIPDVDIRRFIDEQTSLQSFRLFSGVKVSSLDKAKELMDWSHRHGVSIAKISICGDCFDPDERKVIEKNIPKRRWRVAYALFGVSAILVGAMSLWSACLTSTIGQLKSSERWIFMSERSVSAFSFVPFSNSALDIGDCKNPTPKRIERTQFSADEVKTLCKLLDAPEWAAYVKESKEEQRWSFVFLALICAGVFYKIYSNVSKWWEARQLLERAIFD